MTKKGLLQRLSEGPIIGDGGFVFAMEKRGYVKAGPWTPEVVMEQPDAGNDHLDETSAMERYWTCVLFAPMSG